MGWSTASKFLAWMGLSLESKVQQVDSVTRGSSRGLWLLSRKPVDPQGTREMVQTAQDLGFDTSVLVNVEQEGCTYGPVSRPGPALLATPAPADTLAQPQQPQVRRRPLAPNPSEDAWVVP